MTITHHCSECGNQVDEYCEDHPSTIVESIVSEGFVVKRTADEKAERQHELDQLRRPNNFTGKHRVVLWYKGRRWLGPTNLLGHSAHRKVLWDYHGRYPVARNDGPMVLLPGLSDASPAGIRARSS